MNIFTESLTGCELICVFWSHLVYLGSQHREMLSVEPDKTNSICPHLTPIQSGTQPVFISLV